MINLSKIISNMPYFIVWFYLLCLLFFSLTAEYYNWFVAIENVEAVLLLAISLHFIDNPKAYNKRNVCSLRTIIFLSFLTHFYQYLNETIYYVVYTIIIAIWLLTTLKSNK